MRETTVALLLLFAAPVALAQEAEPTVNESDYDTSPPPSNESYLDESAEEAGIEEEPSSEPTLTEGDLDTSAPTTDTSYLDEAEREMEGSGDAGTHAAPTPGFGAVAALLASLAAVLTLGRRK